MSINIITFLEAIGGVVSGLYSVWLGYRHIRANLEFKKEKERQEILENAKKEIAKVEFKLNEKIKILEEEIKIHKANLDKDLVHMKELYDGELKNLGNKIDELRKDLSDQHSYMVALLTKMIDTR